MKVIFLDFDGVLNSAASFLWEKRKKTLRLADTLNPVCCSNLQYILENDSSIKIVISSTWRKLHSLVELHNILKSYGVESARIIGKTPMFMNSHRGREIRAWLDENPGITKYVILDDDSDALGALSIYDEKKDELVPDEKGHFFQTTWEDGLNMSTAIKVINLFRGEKPKSTKEVDYTPFII